MDEIRKYFLNKFYCKAKERGARNVAVELKFPVVDKEGKAVSYRKIKKFWSHLDDLGWKLVFDSHTGEVKEAQKGKDCIAAATGYPKIEFSSAPEENLFELSKRVEELKEVITPFCEEEGASFLGAGVQPVTPPHKSLRMKKARNLYWDEVFGSNNVILPEHGSDVDLFTISATNQAHVDICYEESISACNVFNGLAGAQIALNANSTVWKNRVDPSYRAVSQAFWDWWLPNSNRVGVPEKRFSDFEDYINTIISFKPVFIIRDEGSISLSNFASFAEYYSSAKYHAKTAEGREVEVEPEPQDFDLHNTFFWYNARISRHCTLENRVNCQQPPEDLMVVAALSLGLAENLAEGERLINSYKWEELRKSRVQAYKKGLSAKVSGEPISELCHNMLDVAEKGLRKRGKAEEVFLDPLKERLKESNIPAYKAEGYFKKAGVEKLIEKLAV